MFLPHCSSEKFMRKKVSSDIFLKVEVTAGHFSDTLECHHMASQSCKDPKLLLLLDTWREPGACAEAKWQWAPLILCSNPPLLKATCLLSAEVHHSSEHLTQQAQWPNGWNLWFTIGRTSYYHIMRIKERHSIHKFVVYSLVFVRYFW